MSTLAHVVEAAGLATVALGSQRNQIERTAPPRGLWCDFPLGRPLGKPGDPEFQHRVLRHAFALLDAPGPVFDVFPEAIHDDDAVAACTLPPRHDSDVHPAVDEARGLRPRRRDVRQPGRHRPGRRRRRHPRGDRGVRPRRRRPAVEGGRDPGVPARVAQDVRGYDETAALGPSDHVPSAWAGTRRFFDETQGGAVVLRARAAMRDAGAKQPAWFCMAPGDR